jgi:allophanate hydrolase
MISSTLNSLHLPATIEGLKEAYRCGDLTPRAVLTAQLAAVNNDQHNAWISTISPAQLEGYLRYLESKSPDELPLYGVSFAIKDNIDLNSLPTTAGCKAYQYQPEQSAFVVECLIEAGAIPLGKTNLDQFATGLVGTRSPWGAVKNSFSPDYISGGSSSGSAVSVALNQVYFSLGTDTAGSGRVPAAFNNIFGLKATKGLVSCRGVVPACRSLDCVTVFARSAVDLEVIYPIVTEYDVADCYARPKQGSGSIYRSLRGMTIGVPSAEQLQFFGQDDYQAEFERACTKLLQLGANLVEINFAPFIAAAKLLYQGPWVAERYAAIETFFDQDPSQCLPVIETIIGGGRELKAVDAFKAIYQLQAYKVECDQVFSDVDVVLTPTSGAIYTIDEVNADPITLNSTVGYYTNFMNLLDYSAIAMPAGFTANGLPFGVTVFSRAFDDALLLNLAQQWQEALGLPLGATGTYLVSQPWLDIVVCGAHLQGLPLNHQLTSLGAQLKQVTQTSPQYRLYALAGGPPTRPGLVRDEQSGVAIDVEVWSLPQLNIGRLLAQIPHPLGLGSLELADGQWVKGFICEPIGLNGAQDISYLGGWRHYLAKQS